MKILVLEQDKAVLEKARVLSKVGHEVIIGNDTESGLAALERGPFDVVMANLEYPEVGAMDVISTLRKWEQKTGHRAYVMSMGAAPAARGSAIDHIFLKPFSIKDLFEFVEKLDSRPRQSESPVMNFKGALEICDNDEELLRDILEVYQRDTPEIMLQLKKAFDTKNIEQVENQAHALKGASGNICAGPLREAAWNLEQAARHGDIMGIREHLVTVIREYKKLIFWLGKLPPPQNTESS